MAATQAELSELLSRAVTSSSFRTSLAADPAATAQKLNITLDAQQVATMKQIGAQLNTKLASGSLSGAVRFDPNAVAGHGSVSW
jgi:hypothetical protein